jgi:hypothetical protein
MLTWSWIIQITIISIILIFLVHHLINFFKSVLTVPKIKDLVNSPNEKYKNIYETISHNNYRHYDNHSVNDNNNNNNNNNNDRDANSNKINFTLEDILPPNANTTSITNANAHSNNMKNELKNFIKKQLVSDSSLL